MWCVRTLQCKGNWIKNVNTNVHSMRFPNLLAWNKPRRIDIPLNSINESFNATYMYMLVLNVLKCVNEFIFSYLRFCLVWVYHGYTNANIDLWWEGTRLNIFLAQSIPIETEVILIYSFLLAPSLFSSEEFTLLRFWIFLDRII